MINRYKALFFLQYYQIKVRCIGMMFAVRHTLIEANGSQFRVESLEIPGIAFNLTFSFAT
jgi:hypothetical protein